MDVAVVNQHTNRRAASTGGPSTFRQAVESIGRTLLVLAPWRAPLPLGRAWCIWEIFCTVDTDTELRVLLPAAERDAFATALERDFDSIVKVVCAVDVEKAEAHDPADRDNIFAAVRETCGFHKLNVAAAGGLRGALALAGAQVLERAERGGRRGARLAHQLAVAVLGAGQARRGKGDVRAGARGRGAGARRGPPRHAEYRQRPGDFDVVKSSTQQGKLDEAKAMFERVLAGYERRSARTTPSTLITVGNLAIISRQGKLERSEERPGAGGLEQGKL